MPVYTIETPISIRYVTYHVEAKNAESALAYTQTPEFEFEHSPASEHETDGFLPDSIITNDTDYFRQHPGFQEQIIVVKEG